MVDLTRNPSVADIERLLASVNDDEGHHILWVDKKGIAHLSLLPEGVETYKATTGRAAGPRRAPRHPGGVNSPPAQPC